MNDIINLMHADEAIAAWRAAASILALNNGDAKTAKTAVINHVGHGIGDATAEHLVYLIDRLAEEGA